MYYTTTELAAMDRDARNMALANVPLSQELENIREIITSGAVGIKSDSRDVDSVCLGGNFFRQDLDTAPAGDTLLFAWKAGIFLRGLNTLALVSAGSLTLAASLTNYIELDVTGTPTVSSNTSGWTAGRYPLWTVLAGSSSWTQPNVTPVKPLIQILGPNGVTGAMLSTAAATKSPAKDLGTVSGTTSYYFRAPPVAAVVSALKIMSTAAIAGDDTNYFTFTLTNLGPTGSGTTVMLTAGATNTTKATGGFALTAAVMKALSLTSTSANLITAADDILKLTITVTASPTSMANAIAAIDFAFTA